MAEALTVGVSVELHADVDVNVSAAVITRKLPTSEFLIPMP